MAIVKLRLCDEDREKFGGPEWVTFDSAKLDDIDWTTQHKWEMGDDGLDMPIDVVLRVYWPNRLAYGKAAVVWLARTMAGIPTPGIHEFKILPNKLQIVEESSEADGEKPGEGDAVPPDEAPSPEAEPSKKRSR